MKGVNHMKLNRLLRRCLAGICTLALLAPQSLVFTAAAQPQQSTKASAMRNAIAAPSAQEYWNLLSGWTDYSTEGNIAFQNNSDQADFATYRPDIDGTAGFKIDFRIDFPEPEVESTARIVLSAESHYNHFFNIMLTGKNNQVTMNVGFFNGDTWASPVVENTGEMTYNGGLRIVISREENSKYIRFALCDTEGNVLIDKKATDPVYQAQKFLDSSDLKLQVCTVAGGNVFRFSDLHLEAFPDDGVSDEPSAAELWTMPNGWESSAENGEAVLHYKEGTERNIYKPTYYVNCNFRLSFVVTPETQESTAFFCSIFTPGQSAYLRLTCQYNPSGPGFQASESLSLCMGEEYGYGWKTLGGTPWNWTGSAYRVTLAWDYSEQKLTLTRSAVEGDTVEHTVELSLPLMGDDETLFFTLCGDEEMHLDCNSLETAAFALSDFSLQNSKSAAEEWTMPAGWMDVSSVDEVAFCDSGATEQNRRIEALEAMRGFDIRYAAKFNGEARLDAVLVNAYEKGLRVRLLKLPEAERDAYFSKWEATIMNALQLLPLDENGLVYNDPAIQYSTFGLIDCIAVNGSVLEASTLLWKAYTLMAQWQTALGHDSTETHLAAKRIEESLERTFYNEEYGLLNAATGDNCQPDILGTILTVSLGFPLSEKARTEIARYLCEHYDEIVQYGYVCHLPGGTYWEKKITLVPPDQYMDGAYWAPFTGWFVDAIKDYDPALAQRTVKNLITYGYYHGFYECINGKDGKLRDYVNSVTNVLTVARELLTVSAETVTIEGDTSLITGQEGNFAAVVRPENATIRSIAWLLDDEQIGEGMTLHYSFLQPGSYTLSLVVTDTNGTESRSETTVMVHQKILL